MASYYCRVRDRELGPLTSQQVRVLARRGELQPTDMVRKEGEGWAQAARLAGLFPGTSGQPIADLPQASPTPIPATESQRAGALNPAGGGQVAASSKPHLRIAMVAAAGILVAATAITIDRWLRHDARPVPVTTTERPPGPIDSPPNDGPRSIPEDVASTSAQAPTVEPIKPSNGEEEEEEEEEEVENQPPPAAEPLAAPGIPAIVSVVERSLVAITCIRTEGGPVGGAGIIVGDPACVVTNHHVVGELPKQIIVHFSNGSDVDAEGWLSAIPGKDLVALAVKIPDNLPALPIASEVPGKGAQVLAFGSPQGLDASVSEGIVSAVRKGVELAGALPEFYPRSGYDPEAVWIQTTTALSHGNSGGPLVDSQGRLVGINTWSHLGGNDLNFAVDRTHVLELLALANGSRRELAEMPPVPEDEHPPVPQPGTTPGSPAPVDGAAVARMDAVRRRLQSIYDQRRVLLAQMADHQQKVLAIRNLLLEAQAAESALAQQLQQINVHGAQLEADVQRLYQERQLRLQDPIAVRQYDFAIEQRNAELRQLQVERSRVFAAGQEAAGRRSGLQQQGQEAAAAWVSLKGQCAQLRDEWLAAVDVEGAWARGEHELLLQILSEWCALDGQFAEAFFQRAWLYSLMNEYGKAEADFDRALSLDDGARSTALAFRGLMRVRQGNNKEAENDFRNAYKANDDDPWVYFCRGTANLIWHEWPEAERDLKIVRRRAPELSLAATWLALLKGACPDDLMRDAAQAREYAEAAVRMTGGQDWQALRALAAAHAEGGDFATAVSTIERAAAIAQGEHHNTCIKDAALYREKRPLRLWTE